MRQLDKYIEEYIVRKVGSRIDDVAEICAALDGVAESGGDNSGPEVESIQKTIGGANREAWCMCLQQTIEAVIEKYRGVNSSLAAHEGCVAVYGMAPGNQCFQQPKVGDIAFWQSIKNPELGHCGRVTFVFAHGWWSSFEGNTSPNNLGDQREGQVATTKIRNSSSLRGFRFLGFVRPIYTKKHGGNEDVHGEDIQGSLFG